MNDDTQHDPATDDQPTAVQNAIQIDELVRKYMREVAEVKEKLREEKSAFRDTFANDEEYKKLQDEINVITKKRKVVEEKISKISAVAEAKVKVQSLQDDLKNAQDMLNSYLEQYVTTYNQRTIEGFNGKMQEIIPVYKLVQQK